MKALAVISNIILITLCLAPIGQSIPSPFTRSDLIYHATAYALLCLLFLTAKYRKLTCTIFLLAQGVIIEFIQPYFSRHFELYDIYANSLGVLLGLALWKIKERVTK